MGTGIFYPEKSHKKSYEHKTKTTKRWNLELKDDIQVGIKEGVLVKIIGSSVR
jgi:hypothetical protein